MWVQGTQCDGKCTGDKTEYDVNDSYDAHFLKKKGKKIDANMKYGSGSIKGVLFEDRVCLDEGADKCLKNFELVEVVESKGITFL